jgi:hypothetical protein
MPNLGRKYLCVPVYAKRVSIFFHQKKNRKGFHSLNKKTFCLLKSGLKTVYTSKKIQNVNDENQPSKPFLEIHKTTFSAFIAALLTVTHSFF